MHEAWRLITLSQSRSGTRVVPAAILKLWGFADMALALYFRAQGFTPAKYAEAIKQLDQAGAGFGSVPGRTFHCAMDVDGNIHVFDVWESMEHFEKFGETLLPILNKLGVDPGEPQVTTVHDLQNG